jgi:hypothetical protein
MPQSDTTAHTLQQDEAPLPALPSIDGQDDGAEEIGTR